MVISNEWKNYKLDILKFYFKYVGVFEFDIGKWYLFDIIRDKFFVYLLNFGIFFNNFVYVDFCWLIESLGLKNKCLSFNFFFVCIWRFLIFFLVFLYFCL